MFTFLVALLSKETAVMFPFALFILSIHKKGFKKGIIAMIPYISLVGLYLILRSLILYTVFGDTITHQITTQILTMAAATLDYIRLLIIPYPLSPFYPERWYTSIFEPKVLIAIIFLISVAFLAFKLRKDKVMLFLLIFPFIMLAPVIVKVNTFPMTPDFAYISERFLYVPAMSFCLFLSASAVRLAGDRGKRYVVIGWLLVTIVLLPITISANSVWENTFTLNSKIIKDAPNVVSSHNKLGLVYYHNGQLNEAIQEFRAAIKLDPNNPETHNNLGTIYHTQGSIDAALQEYNIALSLNPDYADAHNNLGNLYFEQGRISEATKEYQTAVKLNPDYADTHYNLGNVYFRHGKMDEAIKEYQTSLKLNPDNADVHYDLGNLYFRQGLIDEAIREYRAAVRLNPDNADVHNNLGNLYFKQGRIEEAIKEYQTALKLKPDDADVRFNLETLYNAAKRQRSDRLGH